MQARKLEGELDVKLAAYAKLCSGFEANYKSKPEGSGLGTDQVRPKPSISSFRAIFSLILLKGPGSSYVQLLQFTYIYV